MEIPELGPLLLMGAFVSSALSFVGALFGVLKGPGRTRGVRPWLVGTFLFSLGAFLLLEALFVRGDVSVRYVFERTWTKLPLEYRISGVWGGGEGSILLFLLFLSGILAFHGRIQGVALLAGSGFLSFLSFFLVRSGIFDPTPPDLLHLFPEGAGLPESLQSPFMVVHPPIQFLAYSWVAVTAFLALAHLVEGTCWSETIVRSSRWSFLFLTLGLGLGGLWAYYVLSFGGAWAWDPVETANLLPWLSTTALLHSSRPRERFRDARVLSPFLALLSLALVLFSSLVTRSGLWISVHAFTDPRTHPEPDPLLRLWALVEESPPTALFLSLLLSWTFLSSAALAGALRRRVVRRWGAPLAGIHGASMGALSLVVLVSPSGFLDLVARGGEIGLGALLFLVGFVPFLLHLASEGAPVRVREWERGSLLVASFLFVFALATALGLLLLSVNGFTREPYDSRAPFVAIPLVALLAFTLSRRALGVQGAALLVGVSLALGLAVWRIFPEFSVAGLGFPLLWAASLGASSRIALSFAKRGGNSLGGLLGVYSGILGVLFWSSPPSFLGVPSEGALALLLGASVGVFLSIWGTLSPSRLSFLGPALSGASFGFGIGSLVGALGAWREWKRAGRRPSFDPWPSLAHSGIHLVHLGVVVALLGYAFSTYSSTTLEGVELGVGDHVEIEGRTLTLLPSENRSVEGASPKILEGRLALGGRILPVALVYREGPPTPHWSPLLHVERDLSGDLYVNPVRLHTPRGWVVPGPTQSALPPSTQVDRVVFNVRFLPLAGLSWGGLSLMVLGMILVLSRDLQGLRRSPRPLSGPPRTRISGSSTPGTPPPGRGG